MRIYTGGTFDVPHIGHAIFFQKIQDLFPDSLLYVALNTDEFVLRYKGKAPWYPYDVRKQLILSLHTVNDVIKNEAGEDSRPTILKIRPDVIAIGSDWLEKDYCKQMGFDRYWLEDHNISLIYLPYTKNISSTMLKEMPTWIVK